MWGVSVSFFNFMGLSLTSKVVLVLGVQQSASIMHINISTLFPHRDYRQSRRFSCAVQSVLIMGCVLSISLPRVVPPKF